MSKTHINTFTHLRIGTLAPHGRRPRFMQSIIQDLYNSLHMLYFGSFCCF